MTANEIGAIVVDCAVLLHRETGPGLLETVYEVVLAHDLQARGLSAQRQVPIPIELRGIRFDEGFRADIIVEGKVLRGGPDEGRNQSYCQRRSRLALCVFASPCEKEWPHTKPQRTQRRKEQDDGQ